MPSGWAKAALAVREAPALGVQSHCRRPLNHALTERERCFRPGAPTCSAPPKGVLLRACSSCSRLNALPMEISPEERRSWRRRTRRRRALCLGREGRRESPIS